MNIYNNGRVTLTVGDIERIQQRIVELERESAELVARLVELSKLHSDLTNADVVCDEDENHIGYVIENDQIDEMERLLSVDTQCLNQLKADAAAEAVTECLRIVEQTKTSFNQLPRYHRGVDITPSKFKENAILELKRYAERIKAGENSESSENEIEKAVRLLDGIWPQSQWSSDRFIYLISHPNGSNRYAITDSKDNQNYNYICTRKQFEQVAAERVKAGGL
jgi:hypothetical protein